MEKGKFVQVGMWCAFGLALSLVVNGITFFIGAALLWQISRVGVVIFLFGLLPAVRLQTQPAHVGLVEWVTGLAYLGAGAEALRWLSDLEFNSSWLLFGGLGLWSIVINLLAMRHRLWPPLLAWIGLLSGILLWGVIASGQIASLAFLNALSAGLGAVLLYPIWLVWIGLRMRKA